MKAADNVYAYPLPVWDRFRQPQHAGRLSAAAQMIEAQAGSPATRALLRLQVAVDGAGVRRARFQAYGCPTAIAVGEWLAELLERQPPAQWPAIGAAQIREALEIGDDKAHCALMGEDALRTLAQKMGGKR